MIKVKIIIRKESENVLIRPIMKRRRKMLIMEIIMISKIMKAVYHCNDQVTLGNKVGEVYSIILFYLSLLPLGKGYLGYQIYHYYII